MSSLLLDDFADVSGWTAVASGRATLALSRADAPQGGALRIDFDFHEQGGFAVASKRFAPPLALPARYAFSFSVRGDAPANRLELKLADASGKSVWWARRERFAPPARWQPLAIASGEVEFAWGPAGGGPARELGALEIAIVAGPGGGGRGSLWISDLRLEDRSYRAQPSLRASSARAGSGAGHALDGRDDTAWRSEPGARHWLELDLGEPRELGALVLHWHGDAPRALALKGADAGEPQRLLLPEQRLGGPRTSLYTPGRTLRTLRFELEAKQAEEGVGVREIELLPHEGTRSVVEWLQAVARRERRGLLPRYLLSEQAPWTPVGVAGAASCALLGEAGALEVDRGAFTLEPFLFVDGALVSWADAEVGPELAPGGLPVPSSRWRARGVELVTTAFACGPPEAPLLHARYRLTASGAERRVRLFVALRPFQVTPPWQAFRGLGGVSPIFSLALQGRVVSVNGERTVLPLRTPDGFGAAAFAQGALLPELERGELPARQSARDAFGLASGAFCWDLTLAPGAAQDVELTVPFGAHTGRARESGETISSVREGWRRKLAAPVLRVPESASGAVDALRTAAAHILIVRDGPALQPGPRRYTRTWIRDAATMSAALLRMGSAAEVRDCLRWYAPYQGADGNVPCCVDRNGPDWLPEHDSHGQLVYTLAEYVRFTGDLALAEELWPAVDAAVGYLERLRARRLGAEFTRGERRACHGLLPESVSHEGYLAQPVHAYWDDFWALRGLGDAAWLAGRLGRDAAARRSANLRDALRESLLASIAATMSERGLDTIPASVEWADFDPSATAVALVIDEAAERLPAAALARTYDQYIEGFRKRRDGSVVQESYTPYEMRIIGALLRLGRRSEAHELLDFFLAGRFPRAWNQWPEITWRDPRSPGHLGDLPHAWISAEYVLALLACFAYERPGDDALVLAAGIPERWLAGGFEVGVEGFATAYGPLAYRLRRESDDALLLQIDSEIAAPGGIVVCAPGAESVTVERGPAAVRVRAAG